LDTAGASTCEIQRRMGSRRAPFDEVVERVHVPDIVASPTDTLHRILIRIGEADAAWVARRPGKLPNQRGSGVSDGWIVEMS